MYKPLVLTVYFSLVSLALTTSCAPVTLPPGDVVGDDGDIAPGIAGKMGDPLPGATPEQLATFERGKSVFLKRFDLAEGLGPAFNVSSCGACHERPTPGGSSGLYRNFFLAGRLTEDGAFLPSDSAGMAGGVLRVFSVDASDPFRPSIPADTTIFAQRNAISIFGVGLLAELSDEEILSRADPDDLDGDGISGRPNFDRGFVGRFGRKSQTVSLEGSRSTLVITTCSSSICATASARRLGSSGSNASGVPWATAQYAQFLVQTAPRIMNVAVRCSQHSPTLGQRASSQTVLRLSSRINFLIPTYA